MYDAIEFRGFAQDVAEELAEYSGVPVYNGLTDEWHPTQMLADFLTFTEHTDKPFAEITFCYLGDARFNMADSYLVAGREARDARPHRQPEVALAAARRSSTSPTKRPPSPARRSRSPRTSRRP